MEKINVFYKSEVEYYINELVYVLYKENYFGYLENAIQYKNNIVDFIEDNIGKIPFRQTPLPLSSLGSKYTIYKSNGHTTWYIFFEKEDNDVLVTFITNNHSEIAGFLHI